MLDVVVVGCGKAGENLVRELRTTSCTRVVGVCDVEPLMASQLAIRYGISRHFSDPLQMFDSVRPSVAYIATPPQSHHDQAILALDHGCHVYIEKPLAPSHHEAEAIVRHALLRQRKLTIGYGYYLDPIAVAMRALVANGALGEVVHVESFLGYALDGQFGAPVFADSHHWVHELPGKLVHNSIDHLLNKVTEFVRDENPLVMAHVAQRAQHEGSAFAVPDEMRLMIAGRAVTGYVTFSAHARPLAHSLTVYATRSTACLDFLSGTLTIKSTSSLPGALGRIATTFDQSWQHFRAGRQNLLRFAKSKFHQMAGLRALIDAFHTSIENDSPPPIAYEEILRVSRITERVFSQIDGRRVHTA